MKPTSTRNLTNKVSSNPNSMFTHLSPWSWVVSQTWARVMSLGVGVVSLWVVLCSGLPSTVLAQGVSAQGKYPQKNIRMVVPFPAGGGPDTVGRLIAQLLSTKWGQTITVENVAGASGQIGTQAVVRAAADGYTLLFSPPTPITIAEFFSPKPAYDAATDLAPAALIGRNPAIIVLNSQVKANTLQEFFALAKKDPDKYFYGTPGLGHAFHLTTELILAKVGLEMTNVPYQGSSPAVMGLLAGNTHMLVQSVESVKEHIKSGRLKPVATLEPQRLEAFPEVPTLAEIGIGNLGIMNWYGAFFPTKTPADVVALWEKELLALTRDPTFQTRMKAMSFDPVAYPAQEFVRMMAVERTQWAGVIKSAKISTQK